MESLQAFFEANNSLDIFTLGRYVQQYVDEQWEPVFLSMRDEMIASYDELGDGVYGVYGAKLFKSLHDQFKTLGIRANSRLPGNLNISREWGDDDSDRQRWMWSKITVDGAAIGTIVTVFYHDHIQIRIPRSFRIIPLEAVSKGDVIRVLSEMSDDFRNALDMTEEVAEYMAQLSGDAP